MKRTYQPRRLKMKRTHGFFSAIKDQRGQECLKTEKKQGKKEVNCLELP